MMNLFERTKEVGDRDYPLEFDLEKEVSHAHLHVGLVAVVTPYAGEVMSSLRGESAKITGVIKKRGQIAGYEVDIGGKTFYAPKKDFFVEQKMVEDVFLHDERSQAMRRALIHWEGQRDYHGPAWEGVEQFCYEMAKAGNFCAIESAGWYGYPSSHLKEGPKDGKDWRYVFPTPAGDFSRGSVVVNCHSLLHDAVWTLSTTIFNTRNGIDNSKLNLVGHVDHWERTLLWLIATAESLQEQGFDYTEPLNGIRRRQKDNAKLRSLRAAMLPKIGAAFRKMTGAIWNPPYISIGFGSTRLSPGSVGIHEAPSDERPYAIITIDHFAAENSLYLNHVVKHELIHAALNDTCTEATHGDRFNQMADLVGLPRKFRA